MQITCLIVVIIYLYVPSHLRVDAMEACGGHLLVSIVPCYGDYRYMVIREGESRETIPNG